MERGHEAVEHTADTGFRAFAPTVEGLFEECATAMFGIMYPDVPGRPQFSCAVTAVGATFEDLLVAWLSELLWKAETNHVALTRFRVDRIDLGSVAGRAFGWRADRMELIGPPIKAVTYHGLRIGHNVGWTATVIVDV